MKGLFKVIVFVLILGVIGYWGWHRYNLSELSENLKEAERALSTSADSTQMLSSFTLISTTHQEAKQRSTTPMFAEEYSSIEDRSFALLQQSPSNVANWVRKQRSSAWSSLGSEQNVNPNVNDQDLVTTVHSLEEVVQTGLAAQDRIAEVAIKLQISTDTVKGMPELADEIKKTAEQAEAIAEVGYALATGQKTTLSTT